MVNLSRGATVCLLILFFSLSCLAGPRQEVVINEIAWMGTEISYNDEWIELYNSTDSSLPLDGWVLKATDGIPEINLTGTIPAKGFFLMERTDDETVPELPADQIYSGSLNNDGESLELFDNSGNLVDSLDCSSGWLAGDNSGKKTMERTAEGQWQTSREIGGTPRAQNSFPLAVSLEAEIIYPFGVIFSEVLPSPQGADAEEEWIEIFNQNSFGVDLTGWQITDTVGATKIYIFPEGTIIEAGEYLVLDRPATKIVLNNSGDALKLIQPNGEAADCLEYEKSPREESFNLVETGWIWSASPTPGLANKYSSLASEENETGKIGAERKGLAEINEPFQQEEPSAPSFLLPVALTLASLSGGLIFFLKKQLQTS